MIKEYPVTAVQIREKFEVARELRRPTGVVIRPCLPRFGILDTVRVRSHHCADRTDIEDVGVRAAIEDLRR
jgi:hypothetical protein